MSFYCTGGRGTEKFIVEELTEKLQADNVTRCDGKVFFSFDGQSEKLLSLCTVERIFVLVKSINNFKCKYRKGIRKLKHVLAGISNWNKYADLQREINSGSTYYVENLAECSYGVQEGEVQGNPTKRTRFDSDSTAHEHIHHEVTFRISCKCTGSISQKVSSQEVSRLLAGYIIQATRWRVDLRNPTLEVNIHWSDTSLTIGIPLTREPLSKRKYLHHIGLRSTIAYIMVKQADIQPGDCVIDPMCGAGTVLMEAAQLSPNSILVGCDVDDAQISRAYSNVERVEQHIHLIKSDVTNLPFDTGSVQVVLCDLPFGANYCTKQEVKQLYPKIIKELNRVACSGARVVLLTSSDLKEFLLNTIESFERLDSISNYEAQITTTRDHNDSAVNIPDKTKDSCTEGSGKIMTNSQCTQAILSSKLDEVTTGVEIMQNLQQGPRQWSVKFVHYFKLGETHSHMCLFHIH